MALWPQEFLQWSHFMCICMLSSTTSPLQLYVNGEFVGGCDIATQMQQSGELATLLAKAR